MRPIQRRQVRQLVRDACKANREAPTSYCGLAIDMTITEVQMDGIPIAVMAKNGKWYALAYEVKVKDK